MSRLKTRTLGISVAAVATALTLSVRAQQTGDIDVSPLAVPSGSVAVEPALFGATGQIDVWIGLIDPAVARASGRNAKRGNGRFNAAQQSAYARELDAKQ